MFLPVSIRLGSGSSERTLYDRSIELTNRQLAAFEAEAGDMTEPMALIGADLHAHIEAEFATQGATGMTGRWRMLSPAYGQWKQRHSAGTPILVGLRPMGPVGKHFVTDSKGQTERVSRNMHQSYEVSGQMRLQLLDPSAMHAGPHRLLYAPVSNIAGYHETGTDRMPARPPVDLTLQFSRNIDRTILIWLAGLMEKVGLSGPGSGGG